VRWIADTISGARLVTFEGTSHAPGETDDEETLDAIQHFVTGVRPPPRIDRFLDADEAAPAVGAMT
jgi:hypothetical protein